jgi:hypothetical protein
VTPRIDVMIAGAQKAGTTSLTRYLDDHPSLFAHGDLEFPWFVNPTKYTDYDDAFARHFEGRPTDNELVLAKSVGVMFLPDAPERLAAHNPACRLIVVIRNPVDRAWSAYWYLRRLGLETAPTFEDALALEPSRLAEDFGRHHHMAYRARGDYLPQIERLREHFGTDQVRVVLLDDLDGDGGNEIIETVRWLGLDDLDVVDATARARHNAAAGVRNATLARHLNAPSGAARRLARMLPPGMRGRLRRATWERAIAANERAESRPTMAAATRTQLLDDFRPATEDLGRYLQRDLTPWLQ